MLGLKLIHVSKRGPWVDLNETRDKYGRDSSISMNMVGRFFLFCFLCVLGRGGVVCFVSFFVVVFSCDQAALQMVFSVCPSVCPSVTPFWLCSHHRTIMKFSGAITNDQCKVYAKGQGQRSKVKVTEVTTQLNRFRTVTPVWIHIWWWNDAYSLMLLRRGALLFFKVIRQISNLTQIGRFRIVTQVWIHQWLRNDAQSLK